ncbi:hypothetical protein [Candidatus Poriferisodalis sp.]|uniref:hypothetical protein n=1 Tax=Candidatus Poriferisodalis sp. TaxID=3101277 RepID=UPI003B0153F7
MLWPSASCLPSAWDVVQTTDHDEGAFCATAASLARGPCDVDEHGERLVLRAAEREADRKDAGRRVWKIALALPVEVVVLFAGAAAILEWLRG